ncbi:MAG: EAL domain-containing protein [Planctomycetota bacterium]
MAKSTLILKAHSAPDGRDEFIVVTHSPFFIGRRAENDVQISRPEVSGRHARFRCEEGIWLVSDERSTNGTFVNGVRIHAESAVRIGDTIHFATYGYQAVPSFDDAEVTAVPTQILGPSAEIKRTMALIAIINEQRTYPLFQPIHDLATDRVVGWEALGRGMGGEGPVGAASLFGLAGQNRFEQKLSQRFRESAYYCAQCRHCWPEETGRYLFLNVHPSEVRSERFFESLVTMAGVDLRRWYRVVVEMPESWVGNTQEMRGLVKQIRANGMLVAYDDFGAGQSRISDLLEVPPDFLKFDRQLITQLAENRLKQGLVRAVVDACRDLGVTTIGEGIEEREDQRACRELGIDLGQGFGLTRPMTAYELFQSDPNGLPEECLFVQLNMLESARGVEQP